MQSRMGLGSATLVQRCVRSPRRTAENHEQYIQMTRAIVDIATPLGISVHDHIIVGRNGHASLKGMRLI